RTSARSCSGRYPKHCVARRSLVRDPGHRRHAAPLRRASLAPAFGGRDGVQDVHVDGAADDGHRRAIAEPSVRGAVHVQEERADHHQPPGTSQTSQFAPFMTVTKFAFSAFTRAVRLPAAVVTMFPRTLAM